MAELAKLPKDMVFFTQITMEAGEDGDYLDAMRKANIKGALVGVEAVTPEGLKAVFKDWNYSGDALAKQLQTFKQHGVHVLGSFIFGLPTDKPATFDATVEMALKAGVTFAQFVMMTPFPGTVDFGRWEKEQAVDPTHGRRRPHHPLLADSHRSPPQDVHARIPRMSSDEIRERTQKVWDRFYTWGAIWERSACTPTLRARLGFIFLSKLYRQMYAGTGISTDSARRKKVEAMGALDRAPVQEALPAHAHARSRRTGLARKAVALHGPRSIRHRPGQLSHRPFRRHARQLIGVLRLFNQHENGCPWSGFSDQGKHEPNLACLVILSEVERPAVAFCAAEIRTKMGAPGLDSQTRESTNPTWPDLSS